MWIETSLCLHPPIPSRPQDSQIRWILLYIMQRQRPRHNSIWMVFHNWQDWQLANKVIIDEFRSLICPWGPPECVPRSTQSQPHPSAGRSPRSRIITTDSISIHDLQWKQPLYRMETTPNHGRERSLSTPLFSQFNFPKSTKYWHNPNVPISFHYNALGRIVWSPTCTDQQKSSEDHSTQKISLCYWFYTSL